MEVTIERRAEKTTLNRREREGMKPREITQKYSKEKAEGLMKKLLDRGLWYWDDDFPEDPEDSSGMGSADEGIKIST